jgi:hypothetical protein
MSLVGVGSGWFGRGVGDVAASKFSSGGWRCEPARATRQGGRAAAVVSQFTGDRPGPRSGCATRGSVPQARPRPVQPGRLPAHVRDSSRRRIPTDGVDSISAVQDGGEASSASSPSSAPCRQPPALPMFSAKRAWDSGRVSGFLRWARAAFLAASRALTARANRS